ncbi:helix-turn-helix domain-containing protein [Streptomyces pinistramenti]|uniref:helix-turn-helix domain-containing protein n=1 Tax=Streptomyces pinistramenti TaxID=2884812 RepID=UPI001D090B49|nr:AraC family transcriptional regulator [Streptomyces pinistramenti]MCB5908915.1 AraC family transcriptional regulator [Streptomyces pinistramenti]
MSLSHTKPHLRCLRWSADGSARRERFRAGEALIGPARWAARPRRPDDVELLPLGIGPVWLEKLAAEGGATGRAGLAPRFPSADPLPVMLRERLVAEYAGPGPADALSAQSLVQAAAAVILRVANEGGAVPVREGGLPPCRLAEVVDFIHAHLSQRVTPADLAAVAGIGESHFTRVFKVSTGQSPHRYVTQRRVEHARREPVRTRRADRGHRGVGRVRRPEPSDGNAAALRGGHAAGPARRRRVLTARRKP